MSSSKDIEHVRKVLSDRGDGAVGWDSLYQENMATWDAGSIAPALADLIMSGGLPKGRILVPGCGRGYDVFALAKAGYDALGLDFSVTAIAECKNKLKELNSTAKFIVGDFFKKESDEPKYDLVYDYTFFCALIPSKRNAWAKRMSDLILPGGTLVTLMFPVPKSHMDLNCTDELSSVVGPPYAVSPRLYRDLLLNSLKMLLRQSFLHAIYVITLAVAATALIIGAVLPAATVLLITLSLIATPVISLCYVASICTQLIHAEQVFWNPKRVFKIVIAIIASLFDLFKSGILLNHMLFWVKFSMRSREKLNWRILRNIQYSNHPGAFLDVYRPPIHARTRRQTLPNGVLRPSKITDSRKTPVIIFIYGGAWNSGSKWLYTPVGWLLSRLGFTVVIPSYRSFPQGLICDMAVDIEDSLVWTHANISAYGGDPSNLTLIGHSAGAHLAALVAISPAIHGATLDILAASGRASAAELADASLLLGSYHNHEIAVPSIQACVFMSGVFDLPLQYSHERTRGIEHVSGLYRASGNTFGGMLVNSPIALLGGLLQTLRCVPSSSSSINEGDIDKEKIDSNINNRYSKKKNLKKTPAVFGNDDNDFGDKYKRLSSRLPKRILIVHGISDNVVLPIQSKMFFHAMRAAVPESEILLYNSGNHVTPICGLMHDSPLCSEIVKFVDNNGRLDQKATTMVVNKQQQQQQKQLILPLDFEEIK